MILKLYFSIELNLYTIFNSYTNIIGKEIKYMKK